MCDKCVEIDSEIEHYRRLSPAITDQATLDAIKNLIEQLKVRKLALHPLREE